MEKYFIDMNKKFQSSEGISSLRLITRLLLIKHTHKLVTLLSSTFKLVGSLV